MKITYGLFDDWEGLYINEVLVLEGHSLSVSDVIEEIITRTGPSFPINFETKIIEGIKSGNLPKKEDKVKWKT